ncbi:MAG: MFS transporter [Actinomycetota bacterium]
MSLRDSQDVEEDIDPYVYGRRWRILGVLCMSLVLVVAGNASLNVALPVLGRDLPATQTDLQWLVDVYALIFAGLLFPAGALGDRYGRKGALQVGLAVFALGAFGASTADSAPAVIVMRAVMGAGAAFVMPSTLSLVVVSFPRAERSKAIAIWAGFAGTGASVGVIASGLLLEWFWWGSVFLINVPIALAALGMGAFVLPRSRDRQGRPLDPVGTACSVVALVGLVYGIIEGPHLGWTSPEVLRAWAVGVTALVAFVAWERRTRFPMFDLHWFRDAGFTLGATTIFLGFFTFFGAVFVLALYLQLGLGYTPLQAGLVTLPLAIAVITVAPRSSGLVDRFGVRRVVTAGLLGQAVCFVLLSFASPGISYVYLLVSFMLLGVCRALVTPPSTGQIMRATPVDRAGVGSAVNDVTREVGGALGVALMGSILSARYLAQISGFASTFDGEQRRAVQYSVGRALEVAAGTPEAGRSLEAVHSAFASGMRWSLWAACAVCLLNALLVGKYSSDQRRCTRRRRGR